jgi:pentatricopeptide repeat protein
LADRDGPAHRDLATVNNLVGIAYSQLGQYHAAAAAFERAITAIERHTGTQSAMLPYVRGNLGLAVAHTIDRERAVTILERSLGEFVAAFGPRDAEVGKSHSNLANQLFHLGRHADALRHADAAIASADDLYAAQLDTPKSLRARALVELGRFDEALSTWDELLRSHVQRDAIDYDLLGWQQTSKAEALARADRITEADRTMALALASYDRSVITEERFRARAHVVAARIATRRHEFVRADAELARAWQLFARVHTPADLAMTLEAGAAAALLVAMRG